MKTVFFLPLMLLSSAASAQEALLLYDLKCEELCGAGFLYDRTVTGDKTEHICVKYPLVCGQSCTTDWKISRVAQDSAYSCHTAVQSVRADDKGEDKDADCVRLCGENAVFDRYGDALNGAERICVEYPLPCRNKCLTGWDKKPLVGGTVYSYHKAVQDDTPIDRNAECLRLCGDGFSYDRPGNRMNGKERICVKYPLPCGEECRTGWDIDYSVGGSVYSCQTAIQTKQPIADQKLPCIGAASVGGKGEYGADCLKYCGKGFDYVSNGKRLNGKERICVRYPAGGGNNCTIDWKTEALIQRTVYTCRTAVMSSRRVR